MDDQAPLHEQSTVGWGQEASSCNFPASMGRDSAIPEGPCSAADIRAAVLSRESLLRLRGDRANAEALGYSFQDRHAEGPQRRTRRGTHGRNDYGRGENYLEAAPSYATYDSWR